ncbi:MAG: type VI secretion system protein TssA [Gammaproteobacteria bacterium]|nr:type VI secretion system protein TssA [Gammaproteobacteria bacterium]
MNADLQAKTERYFTEHFGIDVDALLAPIAAAQPGGDSLRGNSVYRGIQEARRQDDPTLPLGPWAHELKRADWQKVGDVAVDALAKQSKDLQLAVWLLEAEINKHGFEGVAPCLALIDAMCQKFWPHLYPAIDGTDIEHRANVIHWANEKLLPIVRQVPITHAGRQDRELHWADWEQAKRNEQLRGAHGGKALEHVEGVNPLEFSAAMAGTASDWHIASYEHLDDALASIDALTQTLNTLCGEAAPGLSSLANLLEQIQTLIGSELHKRGLQLVDEAEEAAMAPDDEQLSDAAPSAPAGGPIRDRATAYARLAEIADYLMHIEPHSPTPYLIKRAIVWGNLNTAELYSELFVKAGGQLNIFEVLGIAGQKSKGE